ncbi:MAG TPA: Rossmann-like and DUF2520 domain-containing protein [Terriglobales bacterium]|nr:Rossmann-like and DUF2520 domain-containing protein [Terriglobales bacterium]
MARFCRAGNGPDMLPAMVAKPGVAIVGPGRLGSALAIELSRAGYRVSELVCRQGSPSGSRVRKLARRLHARLSFPQTACLDAEVIWFCVPDREISSAARTLATRGPWRGKTAFHASGALTSAELGALKRKGARVASVHPLMSFVRGAVPPLKGVPFALEGDRGALRVGARIVHDFGGNAFSIPAKNKAAYHAWGAFASPLAIALLATAEQVANAAGLSPLEARRKMLPILEQTLENYRRWGAAGSLSGPLVRGDAEIIAKHLEILGPISGAKEVYLALSRSALRLIPVEERRKLEKALRD